MSTRVEVAGLDTASNRWHAVTGLPLANSKDRSALRREQIIVKDKNPDVRRHQLHAGISEFYGSLPSGSWVFCEEPMALQNGKTTRLLGLSAGALWAAHLEYNIFWYWVNVAEWKSGIGLKANAKKLEVESWVRENYGWIPDLDDWEEDHFDAFCIRYWGAQRLAEGGLVPAMA